MKRGNFVIFCRSYYNDIFSMFCLVDYLLISFWTCLDWIFGNAVMLHRGTGDMTLESQCLGQVFKVWQSRTQGLSEVLKAAHLELLQ